MGILASFDFNVTILEGENFPLRLVNKLISLGWRCNDGDASMYLPIGDDDMFNWVRSNIQVHELTGILEVKLKAKETIGLVMTWEDSKIGGEFLFNCNDFSISLILSLNRLKNDIFKHTDINWYLEKIIPAINLSGLRLDSFSFSEN